VACRGGIGELVGDVLHENQPKPDMCRALGFALAASPSDAALTIVRKRLGESGPGRR